jgi:hypothetical protein
MLVGEGMKSHRYILAILITLSGCSSSGTDAATNAANVIDDRQLAPHAPSEHRYDFQEGATYGYIADVSEEDQKQGKATGDVVMFTYHGNEGGVYKLRMVDANGRGLGRYECIKPCVAIKAYRSDGLERIAYNPDSVIGSAYQDALNDLLKPVPDVKPPTPRIVPSSWEGQYNGAFEGAPGSITIHDRDDQLTVAIAIGSRRCVGGIEFTAARPVGNTLMKRFPIDDSGNQCTLTLTREGRGISVNEEGCSNYHGFECSFNGAVTK